VKGEIAMAGTRKTTIYLNPRLYRVLKINAAASRRTMSEMVNEAVALSLREDAIDFAAIHKRARERSEPFANALHKLESDKINQ
jgi:hypothetical protein